MTGRDSRTLLAAFRKNDFFPKPGSRIAFLQIERALFGEMDQEKLRALRLENAERERQGKERSGELINLRDVEKMLTEWLVPLAAGLNSAPTTLDTRCNPTDPELARRAISDWVEGTMKPQLRSKALKL